MPTYRSKPTTIEAIQYGPVFEPGLVQRVASFVAGREIEKPTEIIGHVSSYGPWNPPRPEFSMIQVRTGHDGPFAWMPVRLGHWIVRHPELGSLRIVDPDEFASKYEPA